MKGRIFSFILLVSLSSSFQLFAQAFKTADYTKALWMTCRFYGCQRSSTISKTPTNWLLLDHAYNGNKGFDFYLDADNGYSVAGGWSDCGDNVRFGQTQYYSAYVLLKVTIYCPMAMAIIIHQTMPDMKPVKILHGKVDITTPTAFPMC